MKVIRDVVHHQLERARVEALLKSHPKPNSPATELSKASTLSTVILYANPPAVELVVATLDSVDLKE